MCAFLIRKYCDKSTKTIISMQGKGKSRGNNRQMTENRWAAGTAGNTEYMNDE
jgi:hypothetical protein